MQNENIEVLGLGCYPFNWFAYDKARQRMLVEKLSPVCVGLSFFWLAVIVALTKDCETILDAEIIHHSLINRFGR